MATRQHLMANVKESEKQIEPRFSKRIQRLGGRAIKFLSPWFTGIPDRLVLMPGGKMYFVEFKSTGKDLSPRQKIVIAWLVSLGFRVWVIDNNADSGNLVKLIADEMAS